MLLMVKTGRENCIPKNRKHIYAAKESELPYLFVISRQYVPCNGSKVKVRETGNLKITIHRERDRCSAPTPSKKACNICLYFLIAMTYSFPSNHNDPRCIHGPK